MPSFNDLLDLHKRLDDLFLDHQRALLRLDMDRAESALEKYTTELLAHIRDEEALMMPIYSERASVPVGGAVEIFLGEHEKLKRLLVLFQEEIDKIREMEDIESGVLFLLDSQHLFKRLLVHHDNRERKILYPLLDEVTSEEERDQLFAQFELAPEPSSKQILVLATA